MKVLAIDDDIDFQNLLRAKLSQFPMTVVGGADTFLSVLRKGSFDLLLIDLSLGDNPLKGLDLISQIRQSSPTIPIIVLSGNSSEKVVASSLELGVNDYIVKPVDFRPLIVKMQDLLRGHEVYEEKQISSDAITLNKPFLLSVKLKPKSVSESGFVTIGGAYIAKGARVRLSSALIKEIYGVDEVEGFAIGFEMQKEGIYLTSFEISPEKKDLAISVKKWLSDQLIM